MLQSLNAPESFERVQFDATAGFGRCQEKSEHVQKALELAAFNNATPLKALA